MATPTLPRDALSQPIQVLGLYSDTAVRQTVTSSSQRLALPTTSRVYMMVLSQPTWVKFGTNTVDAVADTNGNVLLLPGERTFSRLPGSSYTHVAFIRESADGKISLAPLL